MSPMDPPASDKLDAEMGIHEQKSEHIETSEAAQLQQTINRLSEKEQKKVMRRIDFRLLPILAVMYSISVIDRSNLAFAMVAGMDVDLDLRTGDRYTVLVMVFFVAFILFEIPSNLILPRAGPANWFTFLGIGFGSVLIGMGFTQDWGALAACRAVLGLLEAGFLPGCAYLITCWYTRYEVGTRLSAFWIVSVVASGFAAILAYALSLLDGAGGLAGWRWIFIIEGAVTVAFCAFGWFIIIDFPAKAKGFLKPEEQDFVIARINLDRGDAEEDTLTKAKIISHMKDWRLYVWMFNSIAITFPGYSFSYFLPIILRGGMGFSATEAQLLSAPPYILAAILVVIISRYSDRKKIRGPILAVLQVLTAVGMVITVYGGSNAFRYVGAFICMGALQPTVPLILAFQANNIVSHSKRALGSGICLLGGGVGGVLAGTVFMAKESPHYTTGVWTTFGVAITSAASIVALDLHLHRLNKEARAGHRVNEGIPGFMYTL